MVKWGMLNLYYKPTCPYCVRVLTANETIKAPLTLLNVSAATGAMEALMDKGGKTQVPFLEDTDRGVSMYESNDIITYLSEHYGSGQKVDVPPTGNVCPID
jgi:glutathione S-transferase